jgi:hypothetical protein
MSDADNPKPWFRPKVTGTGWTPQTWQGWLITLVFVVLFTATVQMIMPQGESLTGVWPWLTAARRDLGVPDMGLGLVGGVVALGLEIAAFSAVAWRMSRGVRAPELMGDPRKASMRESNEAKPWFQRRREFGYGYRPASWQGVAATLVFVAVLLATVFSSDPNMARPAHVASFLELKAMVGLSRTHLPAPTMTGLILAEVAAFMFIVWWKSRTLKPLD